MSTLPPGWRWVELTESAMPTCRGWSLQDGTSREVARITANSDMSWRVADAGGLYRVETCLTVNEAHALALDHALVQDVERVLTYEAPVHCPRCAQERGIAIPKHCPHAGHLP